MENNTSIRTIRCIEGILFSYKMVKLLYSRLWDTCSLINNDKEKVYDSLEICWSIVDALHRIREISQQIPLISKKEIYIQDFLRKTALVEEFRNYIQHLRNELNKAEIDNFPVWGSLSWVDKDNESNSYAIIIGAYIENTSLSGCVYDNTERKWLSKVTLSIKDKSFNYDVMFEALKKFIESFAQEIDMRGIKMSETMLNPSILSIRIKYQ